MKSSVCKDRSGELASPPTQVTTGIGQFCSQACISNSFCSHWAPVLLREWPSGVREEYELPFSQEHFRSLGALCMQSSRLGPSPLSGPGLETKGLHQIPGLGVNLACDSTARFLGVPHPPFNA